MRERKRTHALAREDVTVRVFVLICNTWPCENRSCRRVHDAHQLLRGEYQSYLISRGGVGTASSSGLYHM